MLVDFRVSNFLSFSREQRLSMIPTTADKSNLIRLNSIPLLPLAVIFGANSSGKSNFLKAIAFGKQYVLDKLNPKHRNYFSKLESGNREKETVFEYTLYYQGRFFSYGFSFLLNKGEFTEEWLYEIDPNTNSETLLFEWNRINNEFRSDRFSIDNESISKDTLLLHYVNKKLTGNSVKPLEDVYHWFESCLQINFLTTEYHFFETDFSVSADDFTEYLMEFDTGITRILCKRIALSEAKAAMDSSIWKLIESEYQKRKTKIGSGFSFRVKDDLFSFHIQANCLSAYKISLSHGNQEYDFEFSEESDGIRRLFEFLDIIIHPIPYSVTIIDEIDKSLHPLLMEKFLKLFSETFPNPEIQLIFSTHEAHLLDSDSLRTDEIWFSEKMKDNSSRLFSLDIFIESTLLLSEAYLKGDYGAVPFFSRRKKR